MLINSEHIDCYQVKYRINLNGPAVISEFYCTVRDAARTLFYRYHRDYNFHLMTVEKKTLISSRTRFNINSHTGQIISLRGVTTSGGVIRVGSGV